MEMTVKSFISAFLNSFTDIIITKNGKIVFNGRVDDERLQEEHLNSVVKRISAVNGYIRLTIE